MEESPYKDEIRLGCEVCGEKPRWTWNSRGIFHLHACYNCFTTRPNGNEEMKIETICHEKAKEKYRKDDPYIYIELDRLKREYVRNIREHKGIIDPLWKCPGCKETKSIFEFKLLHKNVKCYVCEDIEHSLKRCPVCGEWMLKNRCLCPECEKEGQEKEKKAAVDRQEDFLTKATRSRCISTLKIRKMEITESNIQLIEQLIVAKRIKKMSKHERETYESNYTDVYGKQCADEENHEGRLQTGRGIGGAA